MTTNLEHEINIAALFGLRGVVSRLALEPEDLCRVWGCTKEEAIDVLTGDTPITLAHLYLISDHYAVPIAMFFQFGPTLDDEGNYVEKQPKSLQALKHFNTRNHRLVRRSSD